MSEIKIIIGPPCGGKSAYIAENIAAGDVRIDLDEIAKAIGSNSEHMASGDILSVALSARGAAIDTILKGIDSTAWIIHTNPSDAQIENYKKYGGDLIVINPGIESCMDRAKDRPSGTVDAIEKWFDSPPNIQEQMPLKNRMGAAVERKNLDLSSVELKLDDDSGARKFSGYASVFGGVDSYGDTILPGAYKKTIKKRDRPIQMRWNHHGPVIGKWLIIKEDEKGLYVEGELTPGHSVADDVYASLKHGSVTGLSIGYRAVQIRELGDGKRELKEIELIEISAVESPADIAAQVGSVKSEIEEAKNLKDYERILRDAGFTRNDATALVSGIKSLVQSDSEAETQTAEIAALFQKFK